MDNYALELTPRKKDEKKALKEHLFTKDELIADLKKNNEKGFLGRIFSNKDEEVESEKKDDVELVEKKKETEIEDQVDFLEAVDVDSNAMENPLMKKVEGKAAADEKGKKEIRKKNDSSKDERLEHAEVVTSPNFKAMVNEEKKKKVSVKKIKQSEEKSAKNSEIVAPNFKAVADKEKEIKRETRERFKQSPIRHELRLNEDQQKILDLFVGAVRSGEEEQLRIAVERLADLRIKDGYECQNDAPLNIALRQELFNGVSSIIAYKGEKEVVRVFQFIDMLNLEMAASDFSILPTEVLESSEMYTVAVKYLIWCAKEYEEVPVELEKRVACFVQAGILSFGEVHDLPELQDVIFRSIFEYAKDNLKNPSEIDRKIYQYSLAGFLDGRALKKTAKFKDVIRGHLMSVIEKHQDRTEEIDKKIKEFERVGFVERKDLREDEKVQKVIEKLLVKYLRANKTHPRKLSVRVKEYFHMGLITKEAEKNFLKNA